MQLFDDLLNVLFPNCCHVCHAKLAPHERFVCTHCLDSIPLSNFHRRKLNPMEERFAGIFPFRRATGYYLYTRGGALATLIQDMKYRNFPKIGKMLGEKAAEGLFSTGFFEDVDVIVPVPMHKWKELKRGYNQTHFVADGMSSATGIPVSHALKAVRSHRTQTALSREERLENTSGIFSVANPDEVTGKHVLLIDDVCTTGSTLISASEELLRHSLSDLSLLTVAVTI